jgi:hypothetical protein
VQVTDIMWRFEADPNAIDPAQRTRLFELYRRREIAMEQIQPDGRTLREYSVNELRALPRQRQIDIADLLNTTLKICCRLSGRRGAAWRGAGA